MIAAAALFALSTAAELRIEVVVGEVDPSAEVSALSLRGMVRARLRRERALTVVAAADEVAKLVELKRRSYEARFDDDQHSELGRDVSANALLEVSIRDALPRPLLQLELYAVESSKVIAASVVEWSLLESHEVVDRAVVQLALPLSSPDEQAGEKREDEVDLEALLADPKTSLLAVLPFGAKLNLQKPGLMIVEDLFAEAASLWSWRGELLVDRGTIAEVEREIDRALRATPRVHLSVSPADLEAMFRLRLAGGCRITLETATLPANALLEITQTATATFELQLLSLDRAVVLAAATHPEAEGAIEALIAAMKKPPERPAISRYAAEIEAEWRELHPLVIDGAVDPARRAVALRTFLKNYPDPNPRRRQAEMMLQAIEE